MKLRNVNNKFPFTLPNTHTNKPSHEHTLNIPESSLTLESSLRLYNLRGYIHRRYKP